jgi:hypothetical protein
MVDRQFSGAIGSKGFYVWIIFMSCLNFTCAPPKIVKFSTINLRSDDTEVYQLQRNTIPAAYFPV